MSKTTKFIFEVETIEAGQRKPYGDSFYSYKILSDRPEPEVREFCMNILYKSYEKDKMPNSFAGELLNFQKLSDNNKDKASYEKREQEIYLYKLKTEYTG